MIVLPTKIREAKDFAIELYIIKLRTGITYIAACDEDIQFNGQTYIPIPIQREAISKSVDNVIDNMNLKIADCDYEKLSYIVNGFDFRGSTVTIIRVLYPDCLTDASEAIPIFSGYIDNPSYADGVFSCVVKSEFPMVQVPCRTCQILCNNEFRDEDCCISKEIRTGTLLEGTSQTALYYGNPNMNHFLKDGVVTIGGEARIVKDSTDRVYVNVGFVQELKPGMTFTIQRGCDKIQKNCIERFGNAANFSGFPSIPFESTYR